jgi:hypothetical protein
MFMQLKTGHRVFSDTDQMIEIYGTKQYLCFVKYGIVCKF